MGHVDPTVDPTAEFAAVRTREQLGAALRRLRERAGNPTFGAMATAVFPGRPRRGGGRHPDESKLANWLQGTNAPRDWAQLQQLLIYLKAVPEEIAALRTAYTRIEEERQRARRERARALRSPQKTTAAPERVPRKWRWWTVLTAAAALVVGGAIGFRLTPLAVHPPSLLTFPPCAEDAAIDTGAGFVQLGVGWGPAGEPRPALRVELRLQKDPRRGWVAFSYLAQPSSDRDEVYLAWSYEQQPPDRSRVRECPGRVVNKVSQTPGVLARDGDGWPRWFKACARVPEQLQVAGRTRETCSSWNRPDD